MSMDLCRGFRRSCVEIKENCMQIYMVVSFKFCSLNSYGILFSLATSSIEVMYRNYFILLFVKSKAVILRINSIV